MSRSAAAANPEVSIVVIAFNERAHAAECVRAILGQRTDAAFEIVFVDDGSTDGTAEAVIVAAGGDERSGSSGCRRTADAARPGRPASRPPADG